MHSCPSPPIFLPIAIFLCRFVPPFWVSLSVLCARKLLLLKSLFLDTNSNQIDSIIPHNFGWAAVAVAVAVALAVGVAVAVMVAMAVAVMVAVVVCGDGSYGC